MARKLDGARELLARANRMIANEGVLDAFGHVTMRHPDDPQRYLMSRSRAPELVQPEDVLEFTLELAAGETERCTTLWRACDPRRYLPSAAGRERGVSPSCVIDLAILHFRHGAKAGLSSGCYPGRESAVLGCSRRVRRHHSDCGQAGGRCFACACTRGELDRADASSRRDRCRCHPGRTHVSHHLHGAQCGAANSGARARLRVTVEPGRDAASR